jgi:hypothetical protein
VAVLQGSQTCTSQIGKVRSDKKVSQRAKQSTKSGEDNIKYFEYNKKIFLGAIRDAGDGRAGRKRTCAFVRSSVEQLQHVFNARKTCGWIVGINFGILEPIDRDGAHEEANIGRGLVRAAECSKLRRQHRVSLRLRAVMLSEEGHEYLTQLGLYFLDVAFERQRLHDFRTWPASKKEIAVGVFRCGEVIGRTH